jgi:putative PIN family toxin of toxin-antitoxin system
LVKAVLDTNILVSALFWRGAPYRCVVVAEAGLFELIIADAIMDEFAEVLAEKFLLSREEIAEAVGFIQKIGRTVDISGKLRAVKADADDDKFLEAALAAGAEYVVSGDRHLLQLGKFQHVKILTAQTFLDRITR